MPHSTTMTIRLDPELKSRLDKLAEITHRSKSYMASEAVRDFLAINEWQIQEIKVAISEADEGDFATPEEEATVFNKWGANAD
ncbi:MAG: CopG family ribbon-helix-helix protein [Candidatus Thiodiazotropha sp. L084R]